MMLEEQTIVGQVTIDAHGLISIRKDTVILKDGEEISRTFHHSVLEPGDDTTGQEEKISSIATVVWTADTLAAWATLKGQRNTKSLT